MAIGGVFVVELGGSPLPADVEPLLVAAAVDTDRQLPAAFWLRFRDPDRVVVGKTQAQVGTAVTVSAVPAAGGSAIKLITAEITALEAEYGEAGTFTIVRGYDRSHRMHHGRRTQAWTQATVADVAKALAARNGLRSGDVQSNGTVYDHLVQPGVSDHAFLSGLAAEIGYDLTVHDGKLDLTPPPPAARAPASAGPADQNPLILRPGDDLLRVRAVVTGAEQVGQVEARGWDVATKKALVATAPAATASAAPTGSKPEQLAEALGNPKHFATDVPYATQAEVTAAAKAVADRIAATFARLEAVTRGAPVLQAGTAISLVGLGEPFDGKYTISSAAHRYDSRTGYTTALEVTGRQERSLLGLTGNPRAGGPGAGVVVGEVSDANDPTKQGRVKLKFPWLSEDYVSDWARTVQVGAGKSRGMTVLPEVGDEVLVAFDRGDVRCPYVLGGLHNGVDVPDPGPFPAVDANQGSVTRRSWVSRRGHRIDLLDDDGRTEGLKAATSDSKVIVELDKVNTRITVHSDGTVTVEGAKGVTVDAGTGTLSLKGKEIDLSAQSGGVKVNGGQGGVTIDGGSAAVKVSAPAAALELKGLTATLEGSTQTALKAGAEATITAALVKIN